MMTNSEEIAKSDMYIEQGVIRKARYGSMPILHLGKEYVFEVGKQVSQDDLAVIENSGMYDNVLISEVNSRRFT